MSASPPPWILLRGLTREARHWGDFVPALQAAFPDADVHAIDLPGNGPLWREASPWTVEAMAEHVRAQLRGLGIAPPYRVLAMSLGAMVATAWAASHPQELSACVLINTSMRPFSRFTQRLRPRVWMPLLRLTFADPRERVWEETVLRLTINHCPIDRNKLLDCWMAWRTECPVSRLNALRQLVAAARFRAPVEKPALPVMVLSSANDGLVNPACSWQLAKAWRCAHAEHAVAGHDLPLENGAWVIGQLRHGLPAAKLP